MKLVILGLACLSLTACSRQEAMSIPKNAPANTRCFFAKELGTKMYFVVEPGQQVPRELNLARNYEMAAISQGYGEINQFTVHTVPMDPPAVHLSEIACRRVN